MKYSIHKRNPDGTLMYYEVNAHTSDVKDGTVYFYNMAGGLEAAFRDFDSIVPKGELK